MGLYRPVGHVIKSSELRGKYCADHRGIRKDTVLSSSVNGSRSNIKGGDVFKLSNAEINKVAHTSYSNEFLDMMHKRYDPVWVLRKVITYQINVS